MMMGRGREFGTKLLDEISTANLVRGSSWIETAKSTKLPVNIPGKRFGVLVFVFRFFFSFWDDGLKLLILIGRKKSD